MNDRVKIVSTGLDKMIKDAYCELEFNKDYELLIAIVLSAQTTDKRVNQVTRVLFNKYKTLSELKNAELQDIEDILRILGSFRKKSKYVVELAKILDEEYDGTVPVDRKILESFPGVGRKTVNVFLSEFYDIPEFAVDTHVERVSKRLGLCGKNDNVYEIEMKLRKRFLKEEWSRRHKQFVLFGRYTCKAISPECSICLLHEVCKRK